MSTRTAPATTREAQAAHTRELILDAAVELFSMKGCDGTSLRDIGERSGVKRPLILYHFESKELLWRAAVDEVWGRMETRLFGWATEHGLTPGEQGELSGLEEPGSLRIVHASLPPGRLRPPRISPYSDARRLPSGGSIRVAGRAPQPAATSPSARPSSNRFRPGASSRTVPPDTSSTSWPGPSPSSSRSKPTSSARRL